MKFGIVSLGLLSISAGLNLIATDLAPASAQCVMADIAVQAAIHGSRQRSLQTNEVEMISTPLCVGNTSVSTSIQVQVGGTGQVIQQRRSRHHLEGTGGYPMPVNGPTVAVPVQVQVDVDNPADRLQY
jgi:hypothetical protein